VVLDDLRGLRAEQTKPIQAQLPYRKDVDA
jgi:hypothetical protein